ncbi:MAG: hypothetical protein HFE77_05550 [Clostridiales bacterium]|nr:hypothetical protein [Clostridiales bacterium]
MKKIILLILCLLLLGTLVACRQANASEMRSTAPTDETASVQAQSDKIENKPADQDNHAHTPAEEKQTVADPITGYCGNTQTTVSTTNFFTTVTDTDSFSYTFMGGKSVELTDILINLDYDPDKVCKCECEYNVDTEFGSGYGVNLHDSYARCEKGQADLTQEQVDTIANIIEWLPTHSDAPDTRCGLDNVDAN